MPQPKKGARLGSNPSHQRLMLSNLALSLFEHERITTTEAKAKLLRPFAERLITKAKAGDVHKRRQVLSTIENREIVHKLFAEIAPRFTERNGGYTRILKLGPRNGDGAPMALIELVEGAPARADEETDEGEEARRRRSRLGRRGRTRQSTSVAPDKPVRSRAAEAAEAGAGAGTAAAADKSAASSEGVSEPEVEAGALEGVNDDVDQADTGEPGKPGQTGAGGKEADPES